MGHPTKRVRPRWLALVLSWAVFPTAACFRSPPPADPVPVAAPAPRKAHQPNHQRTINVDVTEEQTAMGAIITMKHHTGATWTCRVTNIGKDPITLRLEKSTFRTARGKALGRLLGNDGDYVVWPDGAARTFHVTPRLLRRLRSDARMWPVMVDGTFELVLSSPSGELRWAGRVFEHQPSDYDITTDEVIAVEAALVRKAPLPPHRSSAVR